MSAMSELSAEEVEVEEASSRHPRPISPEQINRFEGYAAEIFSALGLDLESPATRDTPRRFVRAMLDLTDGYEGDPKLLAVFKTECRGGPDCRVSQLIEGPIQYYSLCEHHVLPVIGRTFIGYIDIIGLSKLVRLVHLYARRFTVQERVGQQIADALEAILQPHGVAVFVEARHLCTQMRGVCEVPAVTRTTYWRGNYDTNESLREEFLRMCERAP